MSITLITDKNLTEDEVLWRYMDLPKFISMLEQKALWLARADTFRDMHEGRFPDDMRKAIEKAYEDFSDDDKSPVKDAEDFQEYLLKNTFISCWHKNFDENMVMWEIYGKNTNAITIQTTVKNMKNNIDSSSLTGHSLILKSVSYQKADEISGVIPYEDCFFRKRPHFAFEKEVRVSLDTYSRLNPSKKTAYGYKLPVQINRFIEKILVHPDSQDWFMDVVNSITKKYGINAPVSRGVYGMK